MDVWPVLGLMLLAILVPTVSLLWFLTEAVRNERMAVRQQLTDVYAAQLQGLLPEVRQFWEERSRSLAEIGAGDAPDERFAALVRADLADSFMLYDEAGHLTYPTAPGAGASDGAFDLGALVAAEQLEYERGNFEGAAAAYTEIAATAGEVRVQAPALQAKARCLAKSGQRSQALAVIAAVADDKCYDDARDEHGRLIVPDMQLFGLELTDDSLRPEYRASLDQLAARLRRYQPPRMPSSQRLFLMDRLRGLDATISFPTRRAEELVARCQRHQSAPPSPGGLSAVLPGEVWQLPSSDRRVAALFTRERVEAEMQALIGRKVPATGARVRFLPRDSIARPAPFLQLHAGPSAPEWELAVYLEGDDPFTTASRRQVTAYRLTALLVVVTIGVMAVTLGRLLLRQMRLANQKNDFVATVSHELKTPLSSMRVLVDTLRQKNYREPGQADEYLALIAAENERLSRLIDNFLSFSRMERNRRTFDLRDTAPAEISKAAMDAASKRFETGGFALACEIQPDLPEIVADSDAMVTVLLNLLDNAYKCARDDKRVTLRCYREEACVCWEVSDHGIGMSRRDAAKVFERFYQVDQSLSRRTGGCGLGLSIVKFIVKAHHGSVSVASEPGKGSTFTVRVPAARQA
ncbi:MAG: HAMP domain-containing sensor histidine kinase [Kiritimatiellae bacterium]|nr:HAMP domain-containing sensor histidine kinase [Kiritimatiellia bacterium]